MLPHHKWEIDVSAGSYYPSLAQEFWGVDLGLSYENDHMGMQFFAFSYHIDELDDVGTKNRLVAHHRHSN